MISIISADKHLENFSTALKAIGEGKARPAFARALNRAGDMANTKVKRALVQQMGIKRVAIDKAVRINKASQANLVYTLTGTGKHFSLIDAKGVKVARRVVPRSDGKFGGSATAQFVSAAAWNAPKVYRGAFMATGMAGTVQGAGAQHIFARQGSGRFPLKKLWGPSVPREMVRGEADKAFEAVVDTVLPRRIEHELGRLLKV